MSALPKRRNQIDRLLSAEESCARENRTLFNEILTVRCVALFPTVKMDVKDLRLIKRRMLINRRNGMVEGLWN